jgi:hypothetical protein
MGWEAIVNGGFEDGIEPWQKFGGELSLVSAPVHSGSAAAALASSTTSTKWLYQSVRVQEGAAYEFAGYLLAGAGVQEAYLRISWYESVDGSGSAIGNADSTARLPGGGAGFAFLTTGSVVAPAGASSARLRVMLAPAGAGAALLYADDLSFGPSDAPTDEGPSSAGGEAAREGGPADEADGPGSAGPAAASANAAEGRPPRPGAVSDTSARTGRGPQAPSAATGPLQSPQRRSSVDVFQVATAVALFAGALVLTHQYLRRQRSKQ